MDPNSVYDSFKRRGEDPSFKNRKRIYEMNYPNEEYRGTSEQNIRMNNDLKQGHLYFNHYGEKMLV